MDNPTLPQKFCPARRRGLIIHGAATLLLMAGAGLSFWLAMRQGAGGAWFVFLLLLVLMLVLPLPFVLYRAYALLNGFYYLDRDGLRLRWGLRHEDIPIDQIEWVRRAEDLGLTLPLPPFYFSGLLVGALTDRDLGPLEYMASDPAALVLVATPQMIFVLSPNETRTFLSLFREAIESGSLLPLQASTSLPGTFFYSLWQDRLARMLVVGGFIFAVLLLSLVGLLIPRLGQVILGFDPLGQPSDFGNPSRLMLLPELGILIYLLDLVLGLIFFQRYNRHPVAYLIWSGGILTSFLLMVALIFLVS